MSNIRRLHLCEMLKKLILENPDYSVSALLSTLMRKGIFGGKEMYYISDQELSSQLENIIEDFKEMSKENEQI